MRRALLAIVVLVFAAATPPAAAQVGHINLHPQGEYVVDQPYTVVAEGSAPTIDILEQHHIRVRIKVAAQSPDCASYETADDGVLVVGADVVAVSPFMRFYHLPAEATHPGRVLVCAWLYWSYEWRAGPASLYVDFQPARHELRIQAPRQVRRGRRATVRFVGTASAKRNLRARIARGSKPCGTSDATNRSARLLQVDGVPAGPISQSARTPRLRRGRYTICTYLHRAVGGERAEAVARHVIRVR
jgi:hypothetical protein